MLHLSEKNTERLAPKMADYLRGQWQDLSDPKVMTGFRQMVDMHNDEHMKKAGVLLVQRRDASGKFEVNTQFCSETTAHSLLNHTAFVNIIASCHTMAA